MVKRGGVMRGGDEKGRVVRGGGEKGQGDERW